MNDLDKLHTLVRLLKEFEFPISPILEYAILEKEKELCTANAPTVNDASVNNFKDQSMNVVCISTPFISLKEEFSKYLYKTKSAATARCYLSAIDRPIRIYINKVVEQNTNSVFAYKTRSEFESCIARLRSDVSFIAENIKRHNALTAALTSYLKFLESKENL